MASRSCTVFVGNIPYDATEQDLREIFGRAGQIDSFRLVYDKDTKQPRGYAFCDYVDNETALNCIKTLNDVECNGRRLRIDLADNALRGGKGGGAAPLALALPAPPLGSSRPALPPALPKVPAAPPAGPAPVGPPMQSGVVQAKPSGPPGTAGAVGAAAGGDPLTGAGASPEAIIAAVAAHAEIAQTVAAMPQAQLQLCLGAMQKLAVEAPENARAFLQDNPQLCYALLHSQLLLGLTLDPILPPDDEETRQLRAEATCRPTMGGLLAPGMRPAGVVVPPSAPGFPGGPPVLGPPVGFLGSQMGSLIGGLFPGAPVVAAGQVVPPPAPPPLLPSVGLAPKAGGLAMVPM